jgi:hypothetical protein
MISEPAKDVAAIFALLDRWRHFPAYQLERRADIFFALYLPGIVEHALGVNVESRVIPEFPIKHEDSIQSDRVDYFLLSQDRSRAFLVELKTEMESRNAKQDAYLTTGKERGLDTLLRHIPIIAAGSDKKGRRKYFHLLWELEQLGLVSLPNDLQDYAFRKRSQGITKRLEAVRSLATDVTVDVLYVQPLNDGREGVIPFRAVAEYLRTLGDPLSTTFADYVESWREPAASSRPG